MNLKDALELAGVDYEMTLIRFSNNEGNCRQSRVSIFVRPECRSGQSCQIRSLRQGQYRNCLFQSGRRIRKSSFLCKPFRLVECSDG